MTCAAESRAQGLSDGCKTVSSVITDDGARTATAVGTLDRTLSTAATTVTRFLASGLEREHTLGAPPRTQYHVPTMVPATKPYADILAEYAKDWQDESTSGLYSGGCPRMRCAWRLSLTPPSTCSACVLHCHS